MAICPPAEKTGMQVQVKGELELDYTLLCLALLVIPKRWEAWASWEFLLLALSHRRVQTSALVGGQRCVHFVLKQVWTGSDWLGSGTRHCQLVLSSFFK